MNVGALVTVSVKVPVGALVGLDPRRARVQSRSTQEIGNHKRHVFLQNKQ